MRPALALIVSLVLLAGCSEPEGFRLQGEILPGTELRSQVVSGEPPPDLDADKPDLYRFHEESSWVNLDGVPRGRRVFATNADAIFNDDDAAYRISFHYSHFGGMPVDAGDFDGDGLSDFLVTDHSTRPATYRM